MNDRKRRRVSMTEAEQVAVRRGENSSSNIMFFAVKALIVVVAVSFCAIFVADWVIGSLQDSIVLTFANVRQQTLDATFRDPELWAKIERRVDRAADPSSDLPPQEKQKIINEVRVIVARWRPVIDAAEDELKKPASAN
jgi:hypothetical protein